jgi:orotidine-5'-phosphate decarboxylase
MSFLAKLQTSWCKSQSLVCVGLDPDPAKLPGSIASAKKPVFEFCKAIVDATADLVCAFKPQIAYFAAAGLEDQLEMTMRYIAEHYPHVLLILDAKRGDIGPTSAMYATEAFDRFGADVVTVNPYLGKDSIEPFLQRADKGVFVLCRTSNPGAADLQDLVCDGKKLYSVVAGKAATQWNEKGNVGLVVGATYPKELQEIRSLAPSVPFLVPGIGAQGGDVQAAVSSGIDKNGAGLVINSSRAIIYASSGKDFPDAARRAAGDLRDEINKYRQTAGSKIG